MACRKVVNNTRTGSKKASTSCLKRFYCRFLFFASRGAFIFNRSLIIFTHYGNNNYVSRCRKGGVIFSFPKYREKKVVTAVWNQLFAINDIRHCCESRSVGRIIRRISIFPYESYHLQTLHNFNSL